MEKPGFSRGHRYFGCFRFDIDAVNPDDCIAILDSTHILLNSDEVPSFCTPCATMNESWQYTRQGLPSKTLEKVTSEISIPTSEEIIVQIKALSINPVDYKL